MDIAIRGRKNSACVEFANNPTAVICAEAQRLNGAKDFHALAAQGKTGINMCWLGPECRITARRRNFHGRRGSCTAIKKCIGVLYVSEKTNSSRLCASALKILCVHLLTAG